MNLKKKKITVMGIGLHGGAVDLITWLSKKGAQIVATDKKSKEKLAPSIAKIKELKNVQIVVGQHRMEDFELADLVIKNPAISWTDKYIQAAIKKGVPVEMDSSLFFERCPTKKIIGVTGTKGKTTTANLIFEILKKTGKKPIRAGIGQGPVISRLEKIKKKSWVVFELSSWRLSVLRRKKISPRYAVITNISQDHLNYYGSMEKYIKDKQAIFQFQKSKGIVVLNYDDEVVREFENKARAEVVWFSKNKIDKNKCVYIEDERIKFNWDGEIGEIVKVEEIGLRGEHNLGNVLAATAAAVMVGISSRIIKEAIKSFKAIPHRLEFVKKSKGVSYYNDTTATTPEAGIAGIRSFGTASEGRSISLIAGGSNKKLNLIPFAKEIAENENVKRVFLLKGAATSELSDLIRENNGGEKIVDTFEYIGEAVKSASSMAEEGGLVLLSPGCASFGMFDNEFDRGEQFREAVKSL